MNGDTRNTKVVVCLIVAMTVGAAMLLWLEPNVATPALTNPLAAVGGTPIEDVVIQYAPADQTPGPSAACVIPPDGTPEWHPASGPQLTLVVVGSEPASALREEQKKTLLSVLGGLAHGASGQAVRVRLHPESDTRVNRDLPRQAEDMLELLVEKRWIH